MDCLLLELVEWHGFRLYRNVCSVFAAAVGRLADRSRDSCRRGAEYTQ